MAMFSMRKVLFLITAVALIAFLVIIGRSSYVHASLQEGQKFDDWIVGCLKDQKKPVCYLSQTLSSASDESKHRVAEFRVGYFGGDALKLIEILPFGVKLHVGTTVISGKELIAPGQYTTCQSFGCIAVADLTKEDIDIIMSNDSNSVAIISVDSQQTNITLSNKGLKEGLEALQK